MCGCWFHTSFVGPEAELVFNKEDLDKACKDSKNQKFESDFKISLQFKSAVQPTDDLREPIGIQIFKYSKVRWDFPHTHTQQQPPPTTNKLHSP